MPLPVNGYVLAGGKSSRMGRDKALLELGGKPLIAHAVGKLQRICRDVHILSSRPELEIFAPLVTDRHPDCGPLGGIEAALLHATHAWSLFLPVDMPFLSELFLGSWVQEINAMLHARVGVFTVGERPQPTPCMLHRQVTPYVQCALERGELKLFPALAGAAAEIAATDGFLLDEVLINKRVEEGRLFANLNTPEEFAAAKQYWDETELDLHLNPMHPKSFQ